MRVFPSGELNEDLRRTLTATLRLVEEGLDDLLEKRGREGILYRVQDDLPESSRQKIQVLAEQALYLLNDLTRRYRLPQQATKVSQLFYVRPPLLWAMVEEARQRDLSGCGLIPTDVVRDVSTRLEELGGLLLQMQEVAAEGRDHGKETPTHCVGP